MNDPPLLTPYWSSAFAKQMKPPTLTPYMTVPYFVRAYAMDELIPGIQQ